MYSTNPDHSSDLSALIVGAPSTLVFLPKCRRHRSSLRLSLLAEVSPPSELLLPQVVFFFFFESQWVFSGAEVSPSSSSSAPFSVFSDHSLQTLKNVHVYSYNELKVATQGFCSSNKIGEGGFGCVYKGRLRDGTVVAAKVLSVDSRQGDREFMSEIAAMSNIRHVNLVKLLGGCADGANRILVYDYMEMNSLAQTLLEYAISGHLTRKSDVYSFGVLLMEIISGQPVVNFNLERGEHYLVEKVWEMYKTNKLLQLVDPTVKGDFPEEEAVRFLKVGLLCVQEIGGLRPQMSRAIKMMCDEVDIEDVKIQKPGLITDFMGVKIGNRNSSQSHGSKSSTSISSQSPQSN
ncbi:hypothetical protein HHK36_016594 [Tetracentron sinense]|uniref:Protein kinase domain-containing protein n=1 Tax=Tetracentron sinense TaxID=13715 RepID=A0A834Z3P4_TETSI|nr:hypothetical protein HHK36_016594 [Tetracentron sinense]